MTKGSQSAMEKIG